MAYQGVNHHYNTQTRDWEKMLTVTFSSLISTLKMSVFRGSDVSVFVKLKLCFNFVPQKRLLHNPSPPSHSEFSIILTVYLLITLHSVVSRVSGILSFHKLADIEMQMPLQWFLLCRVSLVWTRVTKAFQIILNSSWLFKYFSPQSSTIRFTVARNKQKQKKAEMSFSYVKRIADTFNSTILKARQDECTDFELNTGIINKLPTKAVHICKTKPNWTRVRTGTCMRIQQLYHGEQASVSACFHQKLSNASEHKWLHGTFVNILFCSFQK